MHLELRFFANFRETVGQKILAREYEEAAVPVGELLQELVEEYPGLDLFDAEGELREFISVLKNGRDITFLDGLDTRLEDGDVLSVFPPVAGGRSPSIERSFRGISPRIAVEYLLSLGAERTGDRVVEGENWLAEISAAPVSVGPSLTLTDVTVRFEGDPQTLEDVIDQFVQKAMRAGG